MCKVTARRSLNGKIKYSDFTIFENPKSNDEPFMTIVGPQHGIVYLLKDPRDPLLHIYLYETDCLEEVCKI